MRVRVRVQWAISLHILTEWYFFFKLFVILRSHRVGQFLMRPCQLIVAVCVDERSLQKRLFEVTGCRDHGPGNRHSKGNSRALYLEHYFTPVKIAHDSNLLCRRKWHPVYFRTGRRALNSYKFSGSLPALWEQKKKDEKARETIYITLLKCVMR